MEQKGFAITGILYTLLLIAIVSMNLLLYNLLNRKTLLEQIKTDTVNAIEKDSDFDYLFNKINELNSKIATQEEKLKNYILKTKKIELVTYPSNSDFSITTTVPIPNGYNLFSPLYISTSDGSILCRGMEKQGENKIYAVMTNHSSNQITIEGVLYYLVKKID